MALYFLPNLHQNIVTQKFENNKLLKCLIEMLHDAQKLAKCGLVLPHILNISGGIYF